MSEEKSQTAGVDYLDAAVYGDPEEKQYLKVEAEDYQTYTAGEVGGDLADLNITDAVKYESRGSRAEMRMGQVEEGDQYVVSREEPEGAIHQWSPGQDSEGALITIEGGEALVEAHDWSSHGLDATDDKSDTDYTHTCDKCGAEDGGEHGSVEHRAIKGKRLCGKCNYEAESGGSQSSRRGGMGTGGLGR